MNKKLEHKCMKKNKEERNKNKECQHCACLLSSTSLPIVIAFSLLVLPPEYTNEHPIVRTHPETGKKILFVNWTYTKKIIGLEKKESDEILEKIFLHQARLDLTCRFRLTENAVAIWDNRSVQHYAISDFFPGRGLGYERIMDRIAIEGDQPH